MKFRSIGWIALLIVITLTISAANSSALPKQQIRLSFNVGSAYGDRDKFDFQVSKPGCILARVDSWSRSGNSGLAASELALILNGSDRSGYYSRSDGTASNIAPLWLSYAVSSSDVNKVGKWTISIINFTGRGTAKGFISLETPPTRVPCEFQAAVSRTRGQIDLNWRYTGRPFNGLFLVERSTNGRIWYTVPTCTIRPSTRSTSYSCTNTGLTSRTRYFYRACAVASGSQCGGTNVTPAIAVTSK